MSAARKERPSVRATFTRRELDTVLAGLRCWQALSPEQRGTAQFDIASASGSPLGADEIDALCERINAAPRRGA